MYAEEIPADVRELKIDLGKHIIWVGLVALGRAQDYTAILKDTGDDELIEMSERLRGEQTGAIQSICTLVKRALDNADESTSQRTLFMSINRDIRNNTDGIGDTLTKARLIYFHQLIRAASFPGIDLHKVLALILQFGDGV